MGPLHDSLRRVCVELQALLGEIETSDGAVSKPVVLNLEAQLRGLLVMEQEMRLGAPNRRVWSLGQAAVPVLPSFFNGVSKQAPGLAGDEIARCRSAVSDFGESLVTFAEGRELLPVKAADVDLVIFDCDGVLVDSELVSITVIAELLASEGMPLSVDEVGERFIGQSHDFIMRSLTEEFGPPPDSVRDFEAAVLAAFPERLRPVKGMGETLDRISVMSCVGSNSDLDRIQLSLGLTGLDSRFADEHLFSAEMVPDPKPSPDLFAHAAKAFDVDPARCLVIEDSVAGVTAAVGAGMQVAGFVGGSHVRPPLSVRLLDAGAQVLVDAAPQIVELCHGP